MFYIACTRFNNVTYQENTGYRIKCKEPVIYGSTLKIRNIYPSGCTIFIVEMNNETNKIEGIGLIKNNLVVEKTHKIYENAEYNRYIYKGKYWLSRDQILTNNAFIVDLFETILFKGKTHLKCRIGITIITNKLLAHWNYEITILKQQIQLLFLQSFPRVSTLPPKILDTPPPFATELEETEEIIPVKRRIQKCK